MTVDVDIQPRRKRRAGEVCAEPPVLPDVSPEQAAGVARIAAALSDPIRVQIVDLLRRHAGKVCVCELVPLFGVSQPTVSHHLKVLRDADLVGVERRGIWAYYYVQPDALAVLSDWLE